VRTDGEAAERLHDTSTVTTTGRGTRQPQGGALIHHACRPNRYA
jgi:hypothetical protein